MKSLTYNSEGYLSRKSIGTRVVLVTGATVCITDVRGKWVHFSDGTQGYVGHIMCVAEEPAPTSKTFTYGTLPSFEEFSKAFEGELYPMTLAEADSDMFANLDLWSIGRYRGNVHGKPSFEYTCEQLFALCEKLSEISDGNVYSTTAEQMWAGDFCSSILSTLGFEWV